MCSIIYTLPVIINILIRSRGYILFLEGDMKWKKKLLLCCLLVDRARDYMH